MFKNRENVSLLNAAARNRLGISALKPLRFVTKRKHRSYAEINPLSINYFQYPEFWVIAKTRKEKRSKKTLVASGDWDKIIDNKVFWSAIYEWPESRETGMLPLDKYVFYTSIKAHFMNGVPWQKTDWYKFLIDQINHNPVKRYEDKKIISHRLKFLDTMFWEFREGIHREQNDKPIVNIGRNGKISIEDGRHRLVIAKIAELSRIKVEIGTIHTSVRPSLLKRLFSTYWIFE